MAKNLRLFISAAAAALLAVLLLPLFDSTWTVLRWSTGVSTDLVVMNATIYTSDPSLPFADAMAVRAGRILRVGNYSSVQDFIGRGTQKLNLHRKVVVPGFIDSHVHLLFGGLQMGQVELQDVKSQDDFVWKVKNAVRDKAPGEWRNLLGNMSMTDKAPVEWILGGGWNNDIWGGDLSIVSWIDEITLDNPV